MPAAPAMPMTRPAIEVTPGAQDIPTTAMTTPDQDRTSHSHISSLEEKKFEEIIGDFPPDGEDDDDDGGDEICEWPYENCCEKGTYQLAFYIDTNTKKPDPYHLCLRHFTVALEYVADQIGDATKFMTFTSGQELTDLVFGTVLMWSHPVAAPLEAEPAPDLDMRKYLNEHFIANPYRSENAFKKDTDSIPASKENPVYIPFTVPVMDAVSRKISSYLKRNHLTLVARKTARDGNDVRSLRWLAGVLRKMTDLVAHNTSTDEALEKIRKMRISHIDSIA